MAALDLSFGYANVADQTKDPGSLLSLYQVLIHFRNESPALRLGETILLDTGHSSVYTVLRVTDSESVLTILNLSRRSVSDYSVDMSPFLSADATSSSVIVGDDSVEPFVGEAYRPIPTLEASDAPVVSYAFKDEGRLPLRLASAGGLTAPSSRSAGAMFVQYYGEVTRPYDRVVSRCPLVLAQLEGWAQASYRDGEAIRAKVGPRGESSLVAKTVHLRVGKVVESSDARRVPITWEATGTPGLFPKMDGELVIARVGDDPTQVKIQGQYAPPLGGLGRLIDQAFLHRVAEATTKELVDRIVEELGAEDE